MALSDEKTREYVQRLLLSRMRILCNHGFYGLLLMHMRYAVDENTETAYTDGERIVFGPEFLENLSDSELDFVMMHEILHVVLQHCNRGLDYDNQDLFNVACDIVVNSNLMLEKGVAPGRFMLGKYGNPMHLAPDGTDGYKLMAEEVYKLLVTEMSSGKDLNDKTIQEKLTGGKPIEGCGSDSAVWDDHSKWGEDGDPASRDEWAKRIADAAKSVEIRDASTGRDDMPLLAKRILDEFTRPKIDWRVILNDFVQEEIVDYSFSPPDKRFDGGDFYLPDFNEKDEAVKDILFMVDTSGSMSDEMITEAYSEIKGAIEQFNGRLCGWLGFFDAKVVPPIPFSSIDEFEVIRPKGGGGTNFDVIFEYVGKSMETPPASIIIITDGYAPFPKERAAMGIPVLWIINNDKVTPKWGRVARLPSE